MKVTEIAFVVYPVTDLPGARKFYEDILGLKVSTIFGKEHAWIEYEIGPGTLAITNYDPALKPFAGGGIAGLEVDDLSAAVEQVRATGIGTVSGPHETPVCHLAFISDPDGNSIILHKRKAG